MDIPPRLSFTVSLCARGHAPLRGVLSVLSLGAKLVVHFLLPTVELSLVLVRSSAGLCHIEVFRIRDRTVYQKDWYCDNGLK